MRNKGKRTMPMRKKPRWSVQEEARIFLVEPGAKGRTLQQLLTSNTTESLLYTQVILTLWGQV